MHYFCPQTVNPSQSAKIETSSDDQDTWTYEYDSENRLIKAIRTREDETKTVSFKYDPFGRRIEKRVEEVETQYLPSVLKTATYSYVYDNEDIILEIRSGGDDEDGEEQGRRKSGQRHWRKRISKPSVSRFVHGHGIDEPLAIEQKGRVYFYHADGLGSITSLTDAKGQVVQAYDYDSFGNMRQEGNLVKQPYGFTGRECDSETGLYFYRARYYDPQMGRFISKDPIGFGGGINVYAYVGGNPINKIDPRGLDNPGCDMWPDYGPCSLECCAKHDECYDQNNCTASSWCSEQGDKQCDECNSEVGRCLALCFMIDAGRDYENSPN